MKYGIENLDGDWWNGVEWVDDEDERKLYGKVSEFPVEVSENNDGMFWGGLCPPISCGGDYEYYVLPDDNEPVAWVVEVASNV